MIIDYIKLSPTDNITLLVSTPVPRKCQAALAARLLERVGGEQVGYIEAPTHPEAQARLQMMGGEFCGNATMSLGALIARRNSLPENGEEELLIEVSGCDAPVPCRIQQDGRGWVGRVQMPLPQKCGIIRLESDAGMFDAPMIRFPGITHLILSAAMELDEAELRRRLPEWNHTIGADALGALKWDETASSIDPLVYVPSAGTLVREHGCGSGTAAIGCMLAIAEGKSVVVPVRQPGGIITVYADERDGAITSLAINGRVEIVEEGTIRIE